MNELNIVLSTNERYMPGATVALAGVALNVKACARRDFRAESFVVVNKKVL